MLLRISVCFGLLLACYPSLLYADNERRGLDLFGRGQYAEALEAWETGAAKGDAGAAYRVGSVYLNRILAFPIKEPNQAKGLAYLNQAARAGEPRAELELATLYERGYGVLQNEQEATRLYVRAAEKGLPAAQFHAAKMLERSGDFIIAYKYYLLAKWQGYRQEASQALRRLAKNLSTTEIKQAARHARDFIPQEGDLQQESANPRSLQ